MTDTPEAVRLADELEDMTCIWSPSDNRDLVNKAAALLRRIPELEAERDQLRAELEKLRVPEGGGAGACRAYRGHERRSGHGLVPL